LTVEKNTVHSPAKTSAGRYVRSGFSHNKIHITLKPEYSLYEIVAIVCHECTHHFLFSRNIRIEPEDENEKLTDIAAVYLGFGKYLSYGYKPTERIVGEKIEGGVRTIQKEISHLGYIDLAQIKYLQKRTDKLRKRNEKVLKKRSGNGKTRGGTQEKLQPLRSNCRRKKTGWFRRLKRHSSSMTITFDRRAAEGEAKRSYCARRHDSPAGKYRGV
jgi:hypothetical protein